MKLSDLLCGIPHRKYGFDPETEITGVCYDSRKAKPGFLFVAVAGLEQDGHKYIPSALKNGAVGAVVTKRVKGVPCIMVDDARTALAHIAANFYGHPEREMDIIGLTGTNGKTTTSYIINHLLTQAGRKVGVIGTLGSVINGEKTESDRTTPDSLELYALLRDMKSAGCDTVVMEVSAHGLTLKRVEGITFKVGIFTNLSQDHLDFYGDMESYFEAKAELFEHCEKRVFNYDDEYSQRLIKRFGGTTYSAFSDNADVIAKNIRHLPGRVEYEAINRTDIARMKVMVPGSFTVSNSLAAVACCLEMGMDLYSVAAAMPSFGGVPGRVEVVPTPGPGVVIIDYAHSPDGMEKVIAAAREFTKGKLIALFGAGGDRDKAKRPIMGEVAGRGCDICVVTSDNPRREDPDEIIREILEGMKKVPAQVIVEPDRRKAIKTAVALLSSDEDTLLLLGKGHETYQEINGEKHHLDEREEVAACYR